MIVTMLVMSTVANAIYITSDGILYLVPNGDTFDPFLFEKLVRIAKLFNFIGVFISTSILTYTNWRFALGNALDQADAAQVNNVDEKSE